MRQAEWLCQGEYGSPWPSNPPLGLVASAQQQEQACQRDFLDLIGTISLEQQVAVFLDEVGIQLYLLEW